VESLLVERVQRGDNAAFAELVRQHQALAFRAAYLTTGNAADAEDAVQEALLKAHHAIGSFRSDARFAPWLLRIVTNEALNRCRASSRRVALELRATGGEPARSAGNQPEDELLAGERRQTVIDALNELNETDRLVLTYRYFLELPVSEMANILECTESTVRTRLSRAMTRLREHFPQSADHHQEEPTDA
jgi:RNA polymerase sigma-70 factor (ECF subfamily)